jgi:hypothetical protein
LAKLTFCRTALKPLLFDSPYYKEFNGALCFTSMSLVGGREGPELPPSRPTMATTHPELHSLGEAIIQEIMKLSNPSNNWGPNNYSTLVERLPTLFNRVTEFVGDSLALRGPYNGVLY